MTFVRLVRDSQASNSVGASRHTNNVGELCALLFALHWIHDHVALGSLMPESDSMYVNDASDADLESVPIFL